MLDVTQSYDWLDVSRPSQGHRPPPLRFAHVPLATGVRLHYAEQGDATGQALILLHGITDSWFSFSRVLPLLDSRYHVYALDQRGHGESARPAEGYAMADFATDVLAFMDAMGLAHATVVGHSMGSTVAQYVALVAPERVARLVLIGATTHWRTPGMLELQQMVSALEDPVPEEFAYEFQAGTTHRPLPDDFMARVVAESLKLPAHVWRAALAGLLSADYAAHLGDIRMPTLLTWGEHDTYCTRAEQDALLAAMPAVRLRVYPQTGHALHWERPEQFVQDLEEFIMALQRSFLVRDGRSKQKIPTAGGG